MFFLKARESSPSGPFTVTTSPFTTTVVFAGISIPFLPNLDIIFYKNNYQILNNTSPPTFCLTASLFERIPAGVEKIVVPNPYLKGFISPDF